MTDHVSHGGFAAAETERADAERNRVCGLRSGVEKNACERRLATAHLGR